MKEAIIYLRKSLIPGANNDLEKHEEQLRRAVQEQGRTPVIFREEEGHRSGYDDRHRPKFRAAIEYAKTHELCDLFAVTDFTRAWRNAEELPRFIRELHKHGVEFLSLSEPFINYEMLSTATGKLMITNAAASAEFYRNSVSEFLRRANERYKLAGQYVGHKAPFGLKRIGHLKDGSLRFEPVPEQMQVIVDFLKLYVAGTGVILAARELGERGSKWRDNRGQPAVPRPHHLRDTLAKLEFYKGYIEPRLYRQALRLREQRRGRRENHRRLKHAALLLRHLLCCKVCGSRLVQVFGARPDGRPDIRYRHPFNSCAHSYRTFSAARVEASFWEWFEAHIEFEPEQMDALADELTRPVEPPHTNLDLHLRREKISKALARLPKMLAEEDIPPEQYRSLRKDYEAELSDIAQRLSVTPPDPATLSREEVTELLRGLGGLKEIVRAGAALDSAAANRVLRGMFQRVLLLDGRVIGAEPVTQLAPLIK